METTTSIELQESQKMFLLFYTVFELLFPMVLISQLYHMSHMPIQGLENGRQNTKIGYFSISDGHNAKGTHDKANLIAYLCTQCGLLLHVVHNFSVNQPFWS